LLDAYRESARIAERKRNWNGSFLADLNEDPGKEGYGAQAAH
jgi:hypothetical protein